VLCIFSLNILVIVNLFCTELGALNLLLLWGWTRFTFGAVLHHLGMEDLKSYSSMGQAAIFLFIVMILML
jgi:hypothetical protein